MKWADYKKTITALDSTEIKKIEIVAQLVQRRLKLGLTQAELAEKADLKQSAIARLESERARPRLDTLETVSDALGLTITLIENEQFNNITKEKH